MPTYHTEEEKDQTLEENRIYRAILESVEEKQFQWTPKSGKDAGIEQTAKVLEWWWEILDDGDISGRKVKGRCKAVLTSHPNNQFRNWAQALTGKDFAVGTGIDTDDLIGLRAEIAIKKVADKKDPTRVFDEVKDVFPAADGTNEPPF